MQTVREEEMKNAFWQRAEALLSSPEQFVKSGKDVRVGLEEELAIYKKGLSPEDYEPVRDGIVAQNQSWADVELGTFQVELRTPPIVITNGGFNSLVSVYNERLDAIVQSCRERGCVILRIGANPFPLSDKILCTNNNKYQTVPSYHDVNRRAGLNTRVGPNGGVDVGQAAVVGLFQSFQVNLEAKSFADAIEKLNYSLMVGPAFLAVSANSRFLHLQDTGINDIRMLAWEISHDVRTPQEVSYGQKPRVGLPEQYFKDMRDYFDRTARFPFILYNPSHALEIGIGLHWMDTRIKIIDNSLVVEFRLIPTQPSPAEEIGLMLLWLGRVAYAQYIKEKLLPIDCVRENRASAINHGLHGTAWHLTQEGMRRCSMKTIVSEEIEKSILGLKNMGLYNMEFVQPIMERLHRGTPSDLICQRLGSSGGKFSKESIFEALSQCKMVV